jgi:MotA/TolQ/ExbB proton channel family
MDRRLLIICLLAGIVSLIMVGVVAAQEHELIEPGEQPPTSYALWLLNSLGLVGLLATAVGLLNFIGACLVVCLARRPSVVAAFMVFLVLPLLLAALGAVKGTVNAFSAIEMTGVEVKLSQIVGVVSEAMVNPLVALILAIPSFLILSIGLFIKTLKGGTATSPVPLRP